MTPLEEAVRGRIDEWFFSTAEHYAAPVGSEAWRQGLTGYIVHGPGAVEDLLEARKEETRGEGYGRAIDFAAQLIRLPPGVTRSEHTEGIQHAVKHLRNKNPYPQGES